MSYKAIVIGASSGIGARLATDLAAAGYSLGLAARRLELLDSIAKELPVPVVTKAIDVSQADDAAGKLRQLIEEVGGADLIVISAGVGHLNPDLDWDLEAETIAVNVVGFARMVNVAVRYFTAQRSGHLVGISSVAGIRGHGSAPAYGASKAFETVYLQAMQYRLARAQLPVCVTVVQPGFVDTAMARGPTRFWVAPVDVASREILRAIRKKKANVYITKRWRFVGWLLRLLPDAIYFRI